MWGFIGVTAHCTITENENTVPHLLTALLACERFSGSPTGEHIVDKFDKIVTKFNIKQKIGFIVTDNVPYIRRAFEVSFPTISQEEEKAETSEEVNNNLFWQDLDAIDQEE